jgi:hypothetical protein
VEFCLTILNLVKATTLGFICTACAMGDAVPIMTDEKFDSRVNLSGNTEFVYAITWQNTSEESLLRNGRLNTNEAKKDAFFGDMRSDRLALQANNQTKLDLEDQAALALKQKLNQEKLCVQGYEIDNVIWKNTSIKLLGYCL